MKPFRHHVTVPPAGKDACERLCEPSVLLGDAARFLRDAQQAMLIALKKLHQTYGAAEKLKEVERQLRAAGYDR